MEAIEAIQGGGRAGVAAEMGSILVLPSACFLVSLSASHCGAQPGGHGVQLFVEHWVQRAMLRQGVEVEGKDGRQHSQHKMGPF